MEFVRPHSAFARRKVALIHHALFVPYLQRKEVSSLMRKILGLLSRPLQRRSSFNSDLLEQHRNDVFILMHQQIGGLR